MTLLKVKALHILVTGKTMAEALSEISSLIADGTIDEKKIIRTDIEWVEQCWVARVAVHDKK